MITSLSLPFPSTLPQSRHAKLAGIIHGGNIYLPAAGDAFRESLMKMMDDNGIKSETKEKNVKDLGTLHVT